MLLKILITILAIILSVPSQFLQDTVMFAAHKTGSYGKLIYVRTVEPEPKDPTEIFLFGDAMLGRYIGTLMGKYKESDPTFPLTHLPEIISAYSGDPEIVGVNLEAPLADYQISYGEFFFRVAPAAATLLADQGVNFALLANNHMTNQGEGGYEQTKNHLADAGINYVGDPNEIGEFSSYIQEVNGLKIGWLGFNEIQAELDYEKAVELTKEIAEQTDFTIVAIHWGVEYVNVPSATIQDHAHEFIDAGADTVWGTHPHVIQSIENYGDGMIFYSLGDFIFDQYWSAGTQEGLGVMVTIEDDVSDPTYTLIPIKLTDNVGDPYLMDESARTDMLGRLKSYSEQVGVITDENMNFETGILKPW